jgi:hypothetical protein
MDKYIGLDAHTSSCTAAVVSPGGRKLRSQVLEANAKVLIDFIHTIAGTRHLCLEEGTHSTGRLKIILRPTLRRLALRSALPPCRADRCRRCETKPGAEARQDRQVCDPGHQIRAGCGMHQPPAARPGAAHLLPGLQERPAPRGRVEPAGIDPVRQRRLTPGDPCVPEGDLHASRTTSCSTTTSRARTTSPAIPNGRAGTERRAWRSIPTTSRSFGNYD